MTIDKTHFHTVANRDGAAILDIQRGLITTLNPTGAFVWQGLERGEDSDTIAQNLARETGGEVNAIRKDLEEFIDAMKNEKLLDC